MDEETARAVIDAARAIALIDKWDKDLFDALDDALSEFDTLEADRSEEIAQSEPLYGADA